MARGKSNEQAENQSRHQRGRRVKQTPSEDKAECRHTHRNASQQLPPRFSWHGADGLNALTKGFKRHLAGGHIAAQLIHCCHLGQLCPLDGDKLGSGIVLPSGDNAVAQHKETLVLDPVGRSYAAHGILHTADFRAVFEEDVSRLSSQLQCLFLFFGHL